MGLGSQLAIGQTGEDPQHWALERRQAVAGDRDHVVKRALEQLHSWLRQKGYDSDTLQPGVLAPLADGVDGVLVSKAILR